MAGTINRMTKGKTSITWGTTGRWGRRTFEETIGECQQTIPRPTITADIDREHAQRIQDTRRLLSALLT
ncbi:MAG: hypothetical protein CM15mP78_04260 [Candidatus Poseidoniales archaeon]|nr:MAG: hypothetical protein CM15mP78_04260 [Candidatus Poseidoniales archaeon]